MGVYGMSAKSALLSAVALRTPRALYFSSVVHRAPALALRLTALRRGCHSQYVRDNQHPDHGMGHACVIHVFHASRDPTADGSATSAQELFGLTKPIFLAGMNVAAGPELAAAVSNEGGLGVIGGVGATVEYLRDQCKKIKAGLRDKSAPWGIDLLLPQVGGSARKTNKDYTNGELPELIDVIIEEGAALFVSAVGVPPKFAVDKLHAVRSRILARPNAQCTFANRLIARVCTGGHPRDEYDRRPKTRQKGHRRWG